MLLMQSLHKLSTPEQKLEAIIKKHAELVSGDADILDKGDKSTTQSERIRAYHQVTISPGPSGEH